MAALLDGAAPAAAAAEAGFSGCAVVGDLGCDFDLETAVAIAADSRGESGECKSGDGDGC